MSFSTRNLLTIAVLSGSSVMAACDDSPVDPGALAPSGLTVTALGATRTQVTFTGRSGDDRYIVQRAAGTSGGDYAPIDTVEAPPAGGQVTVVDSTGLLASSDYRYRVAAIRGAQLSGFSAVATVRTRAPGEQAAEIAQDITANRTLYPDTVYTLRGFIHVTNGATLTILPGTRIVGDYETVGSSLFIMRGAKINAVGTAELPIVFTSERPAGQRRPGDWGGLVIVGNGMINRTGDIEVEGTGTSSGTASGDNYRIARGNGNGSDNTDDSGELRYVRVEFAGFAPALNQELNSFSFASVGSGTRISYLQALAGLDDSFEFWGGAVDAKYLVSYESGDDHYDMSEGFQGRLQYVIAYQDTVLPPRDNAGAASSDPQGIENDGCDGTGCTSGFGSQPYTIPIVANFTLVGTGKTSLSGSSGGVGMLLRRGAGGFYVNGIVARYPRAGIGIRDSATFARGGGAESPDLATTQLLLRNVLFVETGSTGSQIFETGSGRYAFDPAANALTAGTGTTASLFAAFANDASGTTSASAFDWTPGGAAATTAGLASFSGALQSKAGSAVTGTSFVGAAPPAGQPNARWWNGWTIYAQN